MRMDRYEEENIDNSKKSRTDKNQELYTDVYLNNAYVDISEINEVVNEEKDVIDNNNSKKGVLVLPYEYKEKKYDINDLILEAIAKNDDNLKRSLEQTTEIDSIIKTINENRLKKEKDDNLLSSLLADSDTTTIMEPLGSIIEDTKNYDTSILHKNEMSNELLDELTNENQNMSSEKIKEDNQNNISTTEKEEVDDSLKDEIKINKKVIFIVVGVILLIIVIIGILISKKIIKI